MLKPEDLEQIEKMIDKQLQNSPRQKLAQGDVPPGTIKRRHLEDVVIVFGVIADRPANADTGVKAYFATDTGVLGLWDGDEWLETTLS